MGNIPVETGSTISTFSRWLLPPLPVHTARLKENGKEVVIKVIRPDILPIIKADMKLIYRLARWVPRLLLTDAACARWKWYGNMKNADR